MNLVAVLLYPVAFLLPAAGAMVGESGTVGEAGHHTAVEVAGRNHVWPQVSIEDLAVAGPFSREGSSAVEPRPAWQVRIEQRMQIRIAPRAPLPMRPPPFVGIPGEDDFGVRFVERRIGKCLSIAGIAGVQPDKGSRLLLYMRDRTLISAEVERSCRARDFYSGFYLARSEDGQLCVDRDTLLTRSGMNCKLTRIRQIVQSDD